MRDSNSPVKLRTAELCQREQPGKLQAKSSFRKLSLAGTSSDNRFKPGEAQTIFIPERFLGRL